MSIEVTQPSMLPVFNEGQSMWQLAHEWHITIDAFPIIIQAGFICDLASVPRVFWAFFPPDGLYRAAAVLHDYLYRRKGFSGKFSRMQCDAMFRDVMLATQGIKKHEALTMWLAVRMFGGIPWKSSPPARFAPVIYNVK